MLWPLIPNPRIMRARRRTFSTPDQDRSDEELVRQARAGDANSFQQIVDRHQTVMFNVVLRTVGDPRLAEDVTQDAFVRAWRSLGRFRGGSVRGWLMRIAINRAYDYLRSARRRPTDSMDALDYEPIYPWNSGISAEDPEMFAIRTELANHLERMLAMLSEDQRTAIRLVDLQGFGYDEAAGIMAVAPGTIKSRISRARARLREAIASDSDASELFERHVRQESGTPS
jgi:RNA polymerase sigma-70 factor, ECF subfamily